MTAEAASSNVYVGIFSSEESQRVMRSGSIIDTSTTPGTLLANLVVELSRAERELGTSEREAEEVVGKLYDYIRHGACILGSPLLTNIAARHPILASCTAVPVGGSITSSDDLRLAESYYNLNMGSGYNLTHAANPVEALVQLNEHAAKVEGSGSCERYVGNIAHLNVHHPGIFQFVPVKTRVGGLIHFNISVDVTDEFMTAVQAAGQFGTHDGTTHSSRDLWDLIINSAWKCGDPGILSLERYNLGNALERYHPYTTTAPCAEVGLSPGEVCVFGYINLAACLRGAPGESLDLDLVGDIAECLTQVLDDAVELSRAGAPSVLTSKMLATKRKIGIGICGLADALLWMGVDYGSPLSAKILTDALAVINYRSKVASLRLSRARGPFGGFPLSAYAANTRLLERFGAIESCVETESWRQLARDVMQHGLRNVMTTALPPSGRSALLLGANPSIEPYLMLRDGERLVAPLASHIRYGRVFLDEEGAFHARPTAGRRATWPLSAASDTSLFRTAAEVDPDDHLRLLEPAAKLVDDGVSKTVNLPRHATMDDISRLYLLAWKAGVKALSVYRMD